MEENMVTFGHFPESEAGDDVIWWSDLILAVGFERPEARQASLLQSMYSQTS